MSVMLRTSLALATVRSLRMLLVRSDDRSAWTSPSSRRIHGEVTVLPTGIDLTITHVRNGRTGDATSVRKELAISRVHRCVTVVEHGSQPSCRAAASRPNVGCCV